MRCLGARFGVLQRTAGETAIDRAEYQQCGVVLTRHQLKLYGTIGDISRLHEIFVPASAPDELRHSLELWDAAAQAEHRHDSVEARTLDLTLPQDLPLEANIQISRNIAIHFSESGIGVQLDVQSSIAENGSDNIHAHYCFTTRKIDEFGFCKTKDLEFEKSFWSGRFRGRDMREFLADQINIIALEFGMPTQVFAESHFELGLAPPEPRIERFAYTNPTAEISVAKRAKITASRALKIAENVSNEQLAESNIDDDWDDASIWHSLAKGVELMHENELAEIAQQSARKIQEDKRREEIAAEIQNANDEKIAQIDEILARIGGQDGSSPPTYGDDDSDEHKI